MVRGFALEDSGNFRMEGLYFAKVSNPSFATLGGVQTRIGLNAIGYGSPSASGVTDYSLQVPSQADHKPWEVGWVSDNGFSLDGGYLFKAGSDRGWTAVIGFGAMPKQRYRDGTRGHFNNVGGVLQQQLPNGARLRVYLDAVEERWQGDVAYALQSGQAMPKLQRGRYMGQAWSAYVERTSNAGLMVDRWRLGDWHLKLGIFDSQAHTAHGDFNLIDNVTQAGAGSGTTYQSGPQHRHAQSGEFRAERFWQSSGWRYRVTASIRGRHSLNQIHEADAETAWGSLQVTQPAPSLPQPAIAWTTAQWGAPQEDRVNQATGALRYQVRSAGGLTWSMGMQRTQFNKTVSTPTSMSQRSAAQWLHDLALMLPIAPSWLAYATTLRSLEETGSAPAYAKNPHAVLPPVLARQHEVGMRWQIKPDAALIVNAFELSKPQMGLRPDQFYGLVGQARNRGTEFSFVGQLVKDWNLSAAALWLRPQLKPDLGGVVEPIGRANRLVVGTLTHRQSAALSWDLGWRYQGPMWVDVPNQTRLPGYTVLRAGMRWDLNGYGVPVNVRLLVNNLTHHYAWNSNTAGLLTYARGRVVELRTEWVL